MRRLLRVRLRRTALLLAGYVAFLGGVGLARVAPAPAALWGCAAWMLLLVLWHRRNLACLIVVLGAGLCLGWWRGSLYMDKLAVYQPLYLHKVAFTVRAVDDAVYGRQGQLSFDAADVRTPTGRRLAGKLELSGFGTDAVYQGDRLAVSGKFYPAFGAYQGRISYARLTLLDRQSSVVADVRRRFTAGMQSALPEPLAPFAMGLLIGQRATLPVAVKQELLMVGLTHIIAVSGYNLTIMLEAGRRLLDGGSKRLALILSLGLMALFLLLAGASASIVRAAIVSTLSIMARYFGREFRPLNLIALAAAISAWANPFYVWSDTSWYLSFLAFYGVMVLAPALSRNWRPRWRDALVLNVALESVCAEIMTLPFVLHTFGQMSFIGLPANVLVVTLVPLAMLLSLVAGLAGMLAAAVAGWFAWPARLLLTYMLDSAHLLAGLPHVFVQNLSLSTLQMLYLYLIVAVVTVVLRRRTNRPTYAKITDENQRI